MIKFRPLQCMKHILYLSYDGLTDPLGSSQVLPYILGLEKKGFRYTIISFEKPERFVDGEQTIKQALANKNIRWQPLVYHKSPPVLSTLWDVRSLKKQIKKIHQEDPIHLMHCRSYITALAGVSFKKKQGIPFVFDMRGFYPDERADAGMWEKNHPLFGAVYRYFKNKEKEFLKHADHTVVLTNAGARIMRDGGLTGEPFSGELSVIPCCADMAHFDFGKVDAEKKLQFKKELNITDNTFVLGYSGSVGTWYMLPEMMRFFKTLLKQNEQALFLILSRDNPAEIWLEGERAGVPANKIHITPVTRDDMPTWLSIFNYSIFFILPTFSKQASSPTKQGELMGVGIPVICNIGVGDTQEIVEKTSGGIVIKNMTDEDFDEAAKKCISTVADKSQIRRLGISYYGLNDGIEKYNDIYLSVLAGLIPNKSMVTKKGTNGTL